MNQNLIDTLRKIERRIVDQNALLAAKNEDDFTAVAVDILVEAGSYVLAAASILPSNGSWTRNEAILGGNLIRLYKIISSILDQICQRRRETSMILSRLAFETCINIRYLSNFKDSELYDSYVLYSLQHEKRLRDRILENIEKRGGEPLAIEQRMLDSIRRTEELSAVSLDQMPSRRLKNWGDKDVFQRADAVGLGDAYLAMFGGASHAVHGNWMDLLEYHLDAHDMGFEPRPEWHHPRPQVVLASAKVVTGTIQDYTSSLPYEGIDELFEVHLADLYDRICQIDELHEKFLTRS